MRAQETQAEQPCGEPVGVAESLCERRQQQRVGPQQGAGGEAGEYAAAARTRPVQGREHRRRQLRERREGDRADIRERFAGADQARVGVGRREHRRDHRAPLPEHAPAQVAAGARQQQRRQPVVADHDRERQRGHHDHAGGGTESAEEGEDRERLGARGERQAEHVEIARHRTAGQPELAGPGERQQEHADRQQVGREAPARGAHMARIAALDHREVELVRQRDHRQRAEQHQRQESAAGRRRRRQGARGCDERAGPVVDREHHVGADREQREQLDQRLESHRQHHAARTRASATGAEEHREQRHQHRRERRAVAPATRRTAEERAGEQVETLRDRLQLQRDVGRQPDQRDAGGERADARALAEARSDQVCNRGAVARARLFDQSHQQRPGDEVQQDRADEGRRHPPAVPLRLGDGAVEGPRGAVDRQRQRVHPAPVPRQRPRPALAVQRRGEQQADPEGRAEDQQGAGGHVRSRGKGQGAGEPPPRIRMRSGVLPPAAMGTATGACAGDIAGPLPPDPCPASGSARRPLTPPRPAASGRSVPVAAGTRRPGCGCGRRAFRRWLAGAP
ncbi:MAG: hypothetical protein OMOMHJEC_02847 [Xanthomonadales bacterium]|nr:hypothetical protein [Xanthomonadales bacterium]